MKLGSPPSLADIPHVGDAWDLWTNGYMGTFLEVGADGDVSFAIDAEGQQLDDIGPIMDLHVANREASLSVSGRGYYMATWRLPAGTYAPRIEFLNDDYVDEDCIAILMGDANGSWTP